MVDISKASDATVGMEKSFPMKRFTVSPYRPLGARDQFLSAEAKLAKRSLDQRFHRSEVFDTQIVDDVAWDMMLDALVAIEEGRRNTVSDLCLAAQAPLATAARHLRMLVDHGLMVRHPDPSDGRRAWVTLSGEAEHGLRAFLRHWADRMGADAAMR